MDGLCAAPLLTLPKDIQRLIFDMLPFRVLVRSQQVCTQWNKELLASLKRLTINDSRINGEIFSKIIAKLSPVHFKRIKLGAEAFIWDMSPMVTLTRLSALDIHSSPSISTSAFVRAVSCLTSLQNIYLSRTFINPRQALPAIVEHLPHLTALHILHHTNDVEAADLYPVTKLTNLSYLSLECPKAVSLDDSFMLAVCSSLTKLESLEITHAKVSESLSALSNLKMVTYLIIPSGCFSGKTPSVLSPNMEVMHATFTDESLEALVSQCKHLSYLVAEAQKDSSQYNTNIVVCLSLIKLHHLKTLGIGIELDDDTFEILAKLTSLQELNVGGEASVVIEKLKGSMPRLHSVNGMNVVRQNDSADPYIKFSEAYFYPGKIKEPIEHLASFSRKKGFLTTVGRHIWIQGSDDLIVCKAKVTQAILDGTNNYILLCDELGQFGIFIIDEGEFNFYTDPRAQTFTCLALSTDARIIVAGNNQPEMCVLNTLGDLRFTVKLKYGDDDDTPIKDHVTRLYYKANKHFMIGVLQNGVFTWDYDVPAPVPVAYVKKIPRTIVASTYIPESNILVLADSNGLVTASKIDAMDDTINFQCTDPVSAISAHPTQALIAIATEKDIVIWVPRPFGENFMQDHDAFKVPHSSLVLSPGEKCTEIEWSRSGGLLYAGYSHGTVIQFEKCEKDDVTVGVELKSEKVLENDRLEKCRHVIHFTAEKYLKSIGKEPMLAGKLTGMILELGLIDLEEIIKQESVIIDKVKEALEKLEKELHNINW